MDDDTELSKMLRSETFVASAWRVVTTVNLCAYWLFRHTYDLPEGAQVLWDQGDTYADFLTRLNGVLIDIATLSAIILYLKRKSRTDTTLQRWAAAIVASDTTISTIGASETEDKEAFHKSLLHATAVLNARS
jgi:hypothetical protein